MDINIEKKLTQNRELLERELDGYYSERKTEANLLIEAQRYGLLGGGKRVRAFLLLELCRLFGIDPQRAMPYACAIEMIHASSLIHDDMPCMDDDDMRRGKPSTHKAYGEALALISGDAMMARAFEITASARCLSASQNVSAVQLLAAATGDRGMLAGQTLDTLFAEKKLSFETLLQLHKLKTGRLICAAARLACIASDINEDDERYGAVLTYAEDIGLSFQIIDDILDYEDGKRELNSFMSFMSVDEAKQYAKKLTKEGVEAVAKYDDGTLRALAEYLTVREY